VEAATRRAEAAEERAAAASAEAEAAKRALAEAQAAAASAGSAAARVAALDGELAAARASRDAAASKADFLGRQLEDAQRKHESTVSKLAAADAELEAANARLRAMEGAGTDQRRDTGERLAALTAEVAQLRELAGSRQTQVEVLTATLAARDARLAAVEAAAPAAGEIERLGAVVADKEGTERRLRAALAEADATTTRLRNELDRKDAAMRVKDHELSELAVQLIQARDAEAGAVGAQVSRAVDTAQAAQVARARVELAACQRQLRAAEDETGVMRLGLTDAHEQLAEVRRTLAYVEAANARLEQQNEQLLSQAAAAGLPRVASVPAHTPPAPAAPAALRPAAGAAAGRPAAAAAAAGLLPAGSSAVPVAVPIAAPAAGFSNFASAASVPAAAAPGCAGGAASSSSSSHSGAADMFRGYLHGNQLPVAAALWDAGCNFNECVAAAHCFSGPSAVADALHWANQGGGMAALPPAASAPNM
jgi:chromosome segregation ATPase